MKKIVLFILLTAFFSSCAWFRERKAEHNQPFKNHKEKAGKKYKKPHHK